MFFINVKYCENLLFRDFEKKNVIEIKNTLLLILLYIYIKIINEKNLNQLFEIVY